VNFPDLFFSKKRLIVGDFSKENANVGVYNYTELNKVCEVYMMLTKENREVRKVQALQGERSLTIVLPKEFATVLGIAKGDYLKVEMNGSRLILEKADI
jgi:hypothetical protein